MPNPFAVLRRFWKESHKRRRYASFIAPSSIGTLASDLLHLVRLARYTGTISADEAQLLQKLEMEMETVINLTQKAEFKKLSADRRLVLFESLQRSQDKLLMSIHGTSAPPTARMQ